MLPRFHLSSLGEEKQLLCGFARTFGQTRSGTGDAHASGHDLPLIRALDGSLVCCQQARLRTFPGNDIPGTRGDRFYWIKKGGEKRRVQVALHRPDAARAPVPALPERLFDERPAAVAKLGQFGTSRGDLVQGAARACNGASEMVDEHPWGTTSHAAAIAFLPAFVGNLFGEDGVAHTHNLMDHTPMQALAMGSQPALFGCFAAPAGLVAPALLPAGSAFGAFPGPPLLVVVLRIGGAPLSLHLALQVADGPCIGSKFGTQRLEPDLGLPWHDGDAGRTQVQTDGVCAYGVLRLVMGQAFEYQLHHVALPLPVGAPGTWAGGTAPHQAGVPDLVRQAVGDHRVVPVDDCGNVVVVPQQVALRAPLGPRLQHKAHTRVVALVLDAIQSPALALKARPAGLAQADAIEGPVGTAGERLGQYRIQVLGQPRDPQPFRQLVKGVLGKTVALPQGREGGFPLLRLRAGNGAGCLPGRIGSHAAQALLPCGEHGVVELPPHFQVGTHACGLPGLDRQGQFELKRRRLRFGGRVLLA